MAENVKRLPLASESNEMKKAPSGRMSDDGIKRTPSGKPIQTMYVLNRKGEEEDISFDQILKRIQRLSYGLHELVDPARVTQGVINGMYSGIKTCELDELAAQTCAYMATTHPDFSILAARITTDNLHKNTSDDIGEVAEALYMYKDIRGRSASLISKEVYDFIMQHKDRLNKEIDYTRDFNYDYFGFKTLERSYLLRINNKIIERPQHLIMRVSIGIHLDDLEKALETYHLMSQKYFTHATPTLFNSGTPRPQMSSCFLLCMKADSIEGIFETLKQCALISKTAGGIGVAVQDIRGQNSYIRGTNGISNGLVPMLRVFNDTARYVDQGGGKRKGSFAVYIEPWHSDIFEFLDLRKNHGKEELRARDLFYAVWVPDLFMKRVKENKNWTLMCPNECPGLSETWGEEFEKLYEKYEEENLGKKTVLAQDLWFAILQSQIETGVPYMLYKDSCNAKSNQKNLGTIKCSNLCCEIIEYTSPDEVAVCNLASIALCKFVDTEKKVFNFKKLYEITKIITRNLDKIIERNYYPVKEAERSNRRHRPIGIGVQGLADTFMLLRYPYESDEAKELNKRIFETMYYAALEMSMELAKIYGKYESYEGSPASQGILQFDMWNIKVDNKYWNWNELKEKIKKHGLRNSLLLAPMPTASTSQILGNNESFEPYTSNIYYRRVLSGEFFVVNPHLLKDLFDRGLWDEDMKQQLIAHNGSVQYISEIPRDLKELYKTVWEIKQKNIIDMAADRGAFIDQSQSLNIYIQKPTFAKLSSMHFYGWEKGLKTGAYYLRTQAATDAIKFTVDTQVAKNAAKLKNSEGGAAAVAITREVSRETISTESTVTPNAVCPLRRNNDDQCLMCSG